MNHQEHAMTVFAEECGEIATELLALQKNVLKAMRFGIDEQRDLPTSNRERIETEWQDLLGSMEHLAAKGVNIQPSAAAIAQKMTKIGRYCEYAEELGTLVDEPRLRDAVLVSRVRREVENLIMAKDDPREIVGRGRGLLALLDMETR